MNDYDGEINVVISNEPLYDKINQLKAQIATLNQTIASLNEQIASKDIQISELTSQVSNLTSQVESLTAQVASLTTENAELRAVVEPLREQVATLTEQVSTLTAQVATLTDENAQLTTQVSELQASVQTLTQTVNTLITKLNTINGEDVQNPADYLLETKSQILTALQSKGSSATSSTTFRNYATEIINIPSYPPDETTLLLHLDSTNGLTDSSSYHRPILTCGTGTPTIVTTESKFGNGSLYLDGTCGLYINQTDFFPFQTPEWTIELFFKPVDWGTSETKCAFMWIDYTYPQTNARIYQAFSLTSTTSTKTFYFTHHDFSMTGYYNKSDYGYVNNLDMNAWHHLAITKNSNDSTAFARCYVDGVSSFSNYTSMLNLKYMTLESLPTNIYLGASFQSDTQTLGRMSPCYMNEIRFSSVCRYTSDFTPPTEPFSV